MGLINYLRGDDIALMNGNGAESRALARTGTEREQWSFAPRTSLPQVTEHQALRVADVFACVRVLANAVASLPPHVYRRQPDGTRVRAGDDQRLVQLLRRPEPGSTSADLFSGLMVHLLVYGDAFLAKYRTTGTEIAELGLLDPQAVEVERRGRRIVYRLRRAGRIEEVGPQDIVHVKAMSQDGLRGISTVRAAGKVLGLNQGLISYATAWLGNAARPGGILALGGDAPRDHAGALKEDWQQLFQSQGAGAGAGKIAVLSGGEGGMSFEQVEPPMKDSEFLAQRELAARECARAFGLPAWAIDAEQANSRTYQNVQQANRFLLDHSLRPWLVRIERAFNADSDLLPGGAYLSFNVDAYLRADSAQRAEVYTRALDPERGWMTRAEVRQLEDLPAEEGTDA
jgi:HK97 family phage portal protein